MPGFRARYEFEAMMLNTGWIAALHALLTSPNRGRIWVGMDKGVEKD
jgi:hypothetical protein